MYYSRPTHRLTPFPAKAHGRVHGKNGNRGTSVARICCGAVASPRPWFAQANVLGKRRATWGFDWPRGRGLSSRGPAVATIRVTITVEDDQDEDIGRLSPVSPCSLLGDGHAPVPLKPGDVLWLTNGSIRETTVGQSLQGRHQTLRTSPVTSVKAEHGWLHVTRLSGIV
jgi:hypothetical protein